MIIVFPFCHKDQDQAVRLTDWLQEIGPFPAHDLLIIRDIRASVIPRLHSLFLSYKELVISDDVHNSWPQSPNLMFAKAAKYIEYRPKQPWLWLEPDAIPLRASAFDEIEAEYQRAVQAGKFFLGDFVHLPEPGFRDHCSGVAVYPPNMTHHAGDAVMTPEIAWDVASARQILPKMFQSELILHRWKHPPFKSWEEVEERIFAVRPKCALFHADKTGSLFPLLRQHAEQAMARASDLREHERKITEALQPLRAQLDEKRVQDAREVYNTLADEADAAELPSEIKTSHELKFAEPLPNHRDILVYPWEGQTPWQSKTDSLAEIQRLADRLKQFGDNASHVRAVRMILNDTGVITLPYRYKKRGKWKKRRKKT